MGEYLSPHQLCDGMKESGLGRENGLEAIHEYTKIKSACIDRGAGMRDPIRGGELELVATEGFGSRTNDRCEAIDPTPKVPPRPEIRIALKYEATRYDGSCGFASGGCARAAAPGNSRCLPSQMKSKANLYLDRETPRMVSVASSPSHTRATKLPL